MENGNNSNKEFKLFRANIITEDYLNKLSKNENFINEKKETESLIKTNFSLDEFDEFEINNQSLDLINDLSKDLSSLSEDSEKSIEEEKIKFRSNPVNDEFSISNIQDIKIGENIGKENELNKKKDIFIKDFVNEINSARLDLKKISNKIENFTKNFKPNFCKNEEFFIYKEKKIHYFGGYLECVKFPILLKELILRNLKDNIFLNKIEIVEDLKMPFPLDLKDWKNVDYISKEMEIIQDKNKGQYKLTGFFLCKCVNDGEISAMLNILVIENGISDFVFDKKIKYIGVSVEEFDEKTYFLYINFAK
jgi:hypothetical protein